MKIQGVSNRVKIYSNYNNVAFKGTTTPTQNNSVSDAKEISKEYAQASKSNLVTKPDNIPDLPNLKLSEDIRIRPDLYTDSFVFSANEWPRNLLINDELSKFYFDYDDYNLTKGNDAWFHQEKIKKFLKENKNGPKCFPVYILDEKITYDREPQYFRVGVVFLSKNSNDTGGNLFYFPTMKNHYNDYVKVYSPAEGSNESLTIHRLVNSLDGEYALDIETDERLPRKLMAFYLISEGREDEALERFPELADIIKSKTNELKYYYAQNSNVEPTLTMNDYLARGDLRGAIEDENILLSDELLSQNQELLLKISDYIKDNNLLEKWVNADKKKLGLMLSASSEVRLNRHLVSSILNLMSNAREKVVSENKSNSRLMVERANYLESSKDHLQRYLLKPIKDYENNPNVDIPNCVMLYFDKHWLMDNNPFGAKDLIDWIEGNYNEYVNCVKLPSRKDKAQMQEDLLNALEAAEENYQETNRRSIIFVNGMEKLLRPDFNDSSDIAVMKDLMSSASEDYHSTIIFYAKRPEKLDPGALTSHRVGIKIAIQDDGIFYADYGKELYANK